MLSNGPKASNPMYEIIIGGWENTKSVIRKNKINKREVETPGITNENEFRRFWVRWDGNEIGVGRDLEAEPFMSYADPEAFPITFVGVGTGWGASGIWKFEDGTEIFTPDSQDKIEYKFAPVSGGYLEFEYRGPHNAHICLASGPAEKEPMFEIILGGWDNTKSAIRYRRESPDKVILSTPGLVDPMHYKRFDIHWTNNRVLVRDGSAKVLMEWQSPVMFPITHFGLRTGYGARGHWRIHRFWTGPYMVNKYSGKPSNIIILLSCEYFTSNAIQYNWYYQIQGQMHVTRRSTCIFGICYGQNHPMLVEYTGCPKIQG
ncbi:hypothetical protein ABMA27_006967 [Loxostege sticticalis]|uniref:Farnesoic acid O-methyl transferase domain-containing protein n=1 Tax=Loxostege sticticalis TaxID=481309 RepID=A0ABR3IL44_LOXSC